MESSRIFAEEVDEKIGLLSSCLFLQYEMQNRAFVTVTTQDRACKKQPRFDSFVDRCIASPSVRHHTECLLHRQAL
jgi:hypothetical protein